MKNKFLIVLLALLLTFSVALCCGCDNINEQEQIEENNKGEKVVDPTLVNGFDSLADMYKIKPMGINPQDKFTATINTDTAFVKDGTGSLKYKFISGTTQQFLQLIEYSNLPELDVRTLKSISVDIYNANDVSMKITLAATTSGGATICAVNDVVIPANSWQTVVCGDMDAFSYKKKSNVGGISFLFNTTESGATFYVDNMRVELGAEDLQPVDLVSYVNELYETKPSTAITSEMLDSYVKFVDRTNYALQLYEELTDKSSVASIEDKLSECLELTSSFTPVYSAHEDANGIDKWYYGNGITACQDDDPDYGAIWTVAIDTGTDKEQSLRFENLDVSTCSSVIFYIYNPTDLDLMMNIHGGWSDWNVQTCSIPAKQWTRVEINSKWVERDIAGAFYPIIYSSGASFNGMFKITTVYGATSTESAFKVVEQIKALPAVTELTLADSENISKVREAYDSLPSSLQSKVTNYKVLVECEEKIATLNAGVIDEEIATLISVTPNSSNASERYFKAKELVVKCNALSDSVKEKLTKYQDLLDYQESLNSYMAVIINDLIAALPEVANAEMPRDLQTVMTAKVAYDGLTEAQKQTTQGVEKLNALVAETVKYTALYSPTSENLGVIDTKQDFGTSWTGTKTAGDDAVYGPVMIFDVVSGHSNATREAEFKLLVFDEIKCYEKIVFYVDCPLESDASLRIYKSNWKEYKDIKLVYGWNKVEVETSFFSSDNLSGCFFIMTGRPSPTGTWRVSTVYAYYDEVATQQALEGFTTLVNAIPSEVTLDSESAITQAREYYNNMKEFVQNLVETKTLKKLTDAEKTLESLKSAGEKDIFVAKVNALTTESSAKDIYDLDYQYYFFDSTIKNVVPAETVTKLNEIMSARLADIAGEIDKDIASICTNLDFPRDMVKFNTLFTYIQAKMSQYSELKTNLAQFTALKNARKEYQKYSQVYDLSNTFVGFEREAIADEDFGTIYSATLYVEGGSANQFAKLSMGSISSCTKLIFYIYRPTGNAVVRFYGAVADSSWTCPVEARAYVTEDGWTRVEIDASVLQNAEYDNYLYLLIDDDDFEGNSQSGWLITNIYGCK